MITYTDIVTGKMDEAIKLRKQFDKEVEAFPHVKLDWEEWKERKLYRQRCVKRYVDEIGK